MLFVFSERTKNGKREGKPAYTLDHQDCYDNFSKLFQLKSIQLSTDGSNQMEQLPLSPTVITDLNDDCLVDVFKYLDLVDLCAVADVCFRFRQNSKRHFARSIKKGLFIIECSDGLKIYTQKAQRILAYSMDFHGVELWYQHLLCTSKVLRLFGAHSQNMAITGVGFGQITKTVRIVNKYESLVFDLISLYCSSGTLRTLYICGFIITDEIAYAMRALLQQLRKLNLKHCECSDSFGKMMMPSPELKILYCHSIVLEKHKKGLANIICQPFKKLVSITFIGVYMMNNEFEEFLKLNSQLKKIVLMDHWYVVDNIFESINKHVPSIETIETDRLYTDIFIPFEKFNNLNTLKLYSCTDNGNAHASIDYYMPDFLVQIHVARIPLQRLFMCFRFIKTEGERNLFTNRSNGLIDSISKLNTLKTLSLEINPLEASHVLDICKHLTELRKLFLLNNGLRMIAIDLVKLLEYAGKLEVLCHIDEPKYYNGMIDEQVSIDADIYMKMVQVVQQRDEKKHLSLQLSPALFTRENKSKDLIRAHSDILTLTVFGGKRYNFF